MTQPTVSGFYWYLRAPGEEWTVIRVFEGDRGMMAQAFGTSFKYPLKGFLGTFGPRIAETFKLPKGDEL